MTTPSDTAKLLKHLDLKQYEATALEHLFSLGRTTAPNLAEATNIPQARIYSVLSSLADMGYVKVIPGRPKKYQSKPPDEIIDRACENRRQSFESYRREIESIRDEFLNTFGPLYEQASKDITPTEELFYVVGVGEPSETETRQLYTDAKERVNVLTKSFEYFDEVEPAFSDAVERNLTVQLIFLDPRHLSAENKTIQRETVTTIDATYPEVNYRFSREKLPWRGTLVDPSMNYDTGKAIFLVEEKDVPLHMRQAAVTENGSFVAGMKRYFELIWEHDSYKTPRN
ncbi:TrmB family transcriptional regulator [Halorussus amylolyticus]|uniref:TrmB family transcriptional regulator n=1 Tax=Halorussus amylolyticus TaxID=1126242 RepID=UPI00104A6415|nr:helix-turn-helix domain-containing protein [Halorussus amylolyticus]